MRFEKFSLEAPVSVAAGAVLGCENLTEKYVQVSGTFTATLSIEGRLAAGLPWIVVAAVSAPGLTAVPQTFAELRVNTTAFTSGVPAALLAGRQNRTE